MTGTGLGLAGTAFGLDFGLDFGFDFGFDFEFDFGFGFGSDLGGLGFGVADLAFCGVETRICVFWIVAAVSNSELGALAGDRGSGSTVTETKSSFSHFFLSF